MSPKYLFVVMVALLATNSSSVSAQEAMKPKSLPLVSTQDTHEMDDIVDRLEMLQAMEDGLKDEIENGDQPPLPSKIEAMVSVRTEMNELRKKLETLQKERYKSEPKERRQAREQLQREHDKDQQARLKASKPSKEIIDRRKAEEERMGKENKAFEKAKVIGCSPEETIVHPEDNSRLGPKVILTIHNPYNFPIPEIYDPQNRLVVENLCPHGIVTLTATAWVSVPLFQYGYRRDGEDIRVLRWMIRGEFGTFFSRPYVIDGGAIMYRNAPGRQVDDWIIFIPGLDANGQPGTGERNQPEPPMRPMAIPMPPMRRLPPIPQGPSNTPWR